jgi:hypothetical protein
VICESCLATEITDQLIGAASVLNELRYRPYGKATRISASTTFAYKGAGVDTIFPASPFERRLRDMHTLSQQIQARSAHFESVGQILLGVPPAVFL